MSRRFLSLIAVLSIAAAAVLAVARPGLLAHHNPLAPGIAAAVPAETWAYIDKVENGDGWCDPDAIDSVTTEYVGDTHQLAVCMGNLGEAVHGFSLMVSYDGGLDQCIEKPCLVTSGQVQAQTLLVDDENCLDSNPDANAGDTFWGESLGEGWTCVYTDGFGGSYEAAVIAALAPTCDTPDHGSSQLTAAITCEGGPNATFTLGDDESWGPLAVIDFSVIAPGIDNVEIQYLDVWGDDLVSIGRCDNLGATISAAGAGAPTIPCIGATDIKRQHKRPTPTPTPAPPTSTPRPPTATPPPPPPPTPTPFGGAGPLVVPPVTGSGPSDGNSPWALWLAIGIAGAAAATAGVYLRRAAR
jgi:hypothetical protein